MLPRGRLCQLYINCVEFSQRHCKIVSFQLYILEHWNSEKDVRSCTQGDTASKKNQIFTWKPVFISIRGNPQHISTNFIFNIKFFKCIWKDCRICSQTTLSYHQKTQHIVLSKKIKHTSANYYIWRPYSIIIAGS